jgi:hypothetical protein
VILPILWWWAPGLFTLVDQGSGPTRFAARVDQTQVFAAALVIED